MRSLLRYIQTQNKTSMRCNFTLMKTFWIVVSSMIWYLLSKIHIHSSFFFSVFHTCISALAPLLLRVTNRITRVFVAKVTRACCLQSMIFLGYELSPHFGKFFHRGRYRHKFWAIWYNSWQKYFLLIPCFATFVICFRAKMTQLIGTRVLPDLSILRKKVRKSKEASLRINT